MHFFVDRGLFMRSGEETQHGRTQGLCGKNYIYQ